MESDGIDIWIQYCVFDDFSSGPSQKKNHKNNDNNNENIMLLRLGLCGFFTFIYTGH